MKAGEAIGKGNGFTRVDSLIIVSILVIVAAIIIPRFARANETVRANSLISRLHTIRSQLELARRQHGGVYPDLVGDGWNTLARVSEQDAAYSTGNGDTNDVGPYLMRAQTNPFAPVPDQTSVAADTSAAWQYDEATGAIFAVLPVAKVAELNLSRSDVVSP